MKKTDWNHSIQYYDAVLAAAPSHRGTALDVGCGTGLLACRLAGRYDEVVALDAVRGICQCVETNVRFLVGDVMTFPLEPGSFDCVASAATLHHLPLEAGLMRLGGLVRPGGVLVIIGLYRSQGFVDGVYAAAGMLVSHVLRRVRGMSDVNAPVSDPQTTLPRIQSAAAELLPGASVRRRLLFRYVLTWRRPAI